MFVVLCDRQTQNTITMASSTSLWYQVGRGTDWIRAATFVVLCDRQTDRQINTRHYYHGVIGVIVSVGCGGIKSVAVQTQYELPCLLFLT